MFQFSIIVFLLMKNSLSIPVPRVKTNFNSMKRTSLASRAATTTCSSGSIEGTCEDGHRMKHVMVNNLWKHYCIEKARFSKIRVLCPDFYELSEETNTCHCFKCYIYTKFGQFPGEFKSNSALHSMDEEDEDEEVEEEEDDDDDDDDDEEEEEEEDRKLSKTTRNPENNNQLDAPESAPEGNSKERFRTFTSYVKICFMQNRNGDGCPEGYVAVIKPDVNLCYLISCGYVPTKNDIKSTEEASPSPKAAISATEGRTALTLDLIRVSIASCVERAACPVGTIRLNGVCLNVCPRNFVDETGSCLVDDMQLPKCPSGAVRCSDNTCSWEKIDD